MANIEELKRILKIIEEPDLQPEGTSWDQSFWFRRTSCGTSYCFAGWKAYLDGYVPPELGDYHTASTLVNPQTGRVIEYNDIAMYARKELGLTAAQAGSLFHYDNTLDDLRAVVDRIEKRARADG